MQIHWPLTALFNKGALFFLALLALASVSAQPVESLSGIPAAPRRAEVGKELKRTTTVVNLPFFDDFSKDGSLPDPRLWLDRHVYISQTMPASPPSLGAAVFDGLDEYGLAYELGRLGTDTTDVLTSAYIDLSSPVDSVYLSFYWQPAGNGEAPENTDSLQLQFYNLSNDEWKYAWSTVGSDSNEFQLEMVPVPNGYFQDSFQFRFRSFGAPAGAYDTWLLDYVRLDDGRDRYDTLPLLKDPTFTRPHPSLLIGYEAMPFFHYTNAVATAINEQQLDLYYQENPNTPPPYSPDPIPLNLGIYEISLDGTVLAEDPNGNDQLDNGLDFFTEEMFSVLIDPFIPSGLPRSSEFEINAFQTYEGTGIQFFGPNDTIERRQVFSTYYAYDDGTAERAYHVSDNAGGIIVSRYVIQSLSDSLKGLYIYFFPAEHDVTLNEFKLVVFEENSQGRPGNLIYESDSVYVPQWSTTNFYLPYAFDQAVPLNQTNVFVGIRQIKNTKLPIGFDRNTRGRSKVFYGNVSGGQLFESFLKGTIMMRPYLRYDPADLSSPGFGEVNQLKVEVFPNPVRSVLQVRGADVEERYLFTLYAVNGSPVWEGKLQTQMVVPSGVTEGVYFLQIRDREGKLLPQTLKIFIQP